MSPSQSPRPRQNRPPTCSPKAPDLPSRASLAPKRRFPRGLGSLGSLGASAPPLLGRSSRSGPGRPFSRCWRCSRAERLGWSRARCGLLEITGALKLQIQFGHPKVSERVLLNCKPCSTLASRISGFGSETMRGRQLPVLAKD